jgi:hypothetical protein
MSLYRRRQDEKISKMGSRRNATGKRNVQPPFFVRQFSEIVQKARNRGIGKTIRQIASVSPKLISYSTLNKMDGGQHIHPKLLRLVANLFAMNPLDWIETKIRYVESHMNGYLVAPAKTDRTSNIDPALLAAFQTLRQARIKASKAPKTYLAQRLELQVQYGFGLAGTTSNRVSTKTGQRNSKKDMFTVKSATVRALQCGKNIRPAKFGAICRQLKLPNPMLGALEIAYAEALLGEHLLGDGTVDFSQLSDVEHPRTVCLLIFSTQNAKDLA